MSSDINFDSLAIKKNTFSCISYNCPHLDNTLVQQEILQMKVLWTSLLIYTLCSTTSKTSPVSMLTLWEKCILTTNNC